MKKVLIGLSLLALSATANANFFGNNNNGEWKMGPYGPYYEENDWPEWTPMYWMEEMSNSFDNNDNGYYGNNNGFFGNMPFMGNNYNYNPNMGYGYNMPMNYGNAPMMPPPAMPYPYAVPPMNAPAMPVAPQPTAPAMPTAPVVPNATVGTPGPASTSPATVSH